MGLVGKVTRVVKAQLSPMDQAQLRDSIVASWRRNNDVLLYLFDHVPSKGWRAVPAGSKGRDVSAQFFHLARVRMGWVEYFETGRRPRSPRYDKTKPPTKVAASQCKTTSAIGRSLKTTVAEWKASLRSAVEGRAKTRMFGGDPVRWLGYLIAHDSHHRGQILLALKQNGMRLPDKVALDGLWGRWIDGK